MTSVSRTGTKSLTDPVTGVEFVMVCDSAQATQEGKLYVLGGGWSHTYRLVPQSADVPAPPNQFAIAVSFLIDWNDANRPLPVRITVEGLDGGQPLFEATAQLVAGRPPQMSPGDPLRAVMALPITLQFPKAGGYCARAEMGDGTPAVARFQVSDQAVAVALVPGPPAG
jgi:hypothetical protein